MIVVLAGVFLVSGVGCTSYKAVLEAREQLILAEPVGEYYLGRRYYTHGTRFWGYLRRPRESWDSARLVIFNERLKRQPDRLPEKPASGPAHGFDHNYEYRIYGSYSGSKVYDPNSNFILPEFVLQDYELARKSPGFLFHPKEKYHPKRLPPRQ